MRDENVHSSCESVGIIVVPLRAPDDMLTKRIAHITSLAISANVVRVCKYKVDNE